MPSPFFGVFFIDESDEKNTGSNGFYRKWPLSRQCAQGTGARKCVLVEQIFLDQVGKPINQSRLVREYHRIVSERREFAKYDLRAYFSNYTIKQILKRSTSEAHNADVVGVVEEL